MFAEWNKGVLDSFLIEITRDILKFRDTDNTHLLDKIKDAAGQKGTGKWTAISALEFGMPLTLIGMVSLLGPLCLISCAFYVWKYVVADKPDCWFEQSWTKLLSCRPGSQTRIAPKVTQGPHYDANNNGGTWALLETTFASYFLRKAWVIGKSFLAVSTFVSKELVHSLA